MSPNAGTLCQVRSLAGFELEKLTLAFCLKLRYDLLADGRKQEADHDWEDLSQTNPKKVGSAQTGYAVLFLKFDEPFLG